MSFSDSVSSRERTIVRTSYIGIAANLFLSGFKAVVGLVTGSIAIVLDSVNNLSDALSSVITIIGTKLARKPADKKHPFGHGRVEYLTSLVIAMIILYAGITSTVESVKKIIRPSVPEYSASAIVILASAVIVKILLGLFVKSTGKKVRSDSLVASGKDALMDSIISASTLVAAGIFMLCHISLEAYLGLVISFVIIKAGLDTLKETISKILGERAESGLAKEIKKTIRESCDGIFGAYDLMLNNYGPENHVGSAHIEVPDSWTAEKIDEVSRKIASDVYARHGVVISAVGIYSVNTKQDRCAEIRMRIRDIVLSHREVLQMHGFYVSEEAKKIRFDVVISFDSLDMHQVFAHIVEDVSSAFPDYDVHAHLDIDISD